nr:l-amino acid amidase [Quercus suber]
MMLTVDTAPAPPGQERPYPEPTKTGTIAFDYPKTGLKGDTSYKVWGSLDSGKTPLICLHGGPGAAHNYLLPVSLVFQDYGVPVVMYDQIGCGKSTHFPDKKGDGTFWFPQLFMDELENLKAALGITVFDLFGQSWGGMLAGQYAIERQPQGLRKLIISDSPSDMLVWVQVADELRKGLPNDVQETLTRCEREGKTDTEEYEKAVEVFYSRHLCRVLPFPTELNDSFAQIKEDPTVYETMNGPSEFFVIGTLKGWGITEDLNKITEKTVPGGLLLLNGFYDEHVLCFELSVAYSGIHTAGWDLPQDIGQFSSKIFDKNDTPGCGLRRSTEGMLLYFGHVRCKVRLPVQTPGPESSPGVTTSVMLEMKEQFPSERLSAVSWPTMRCMLARS